MSNGQPRQCSLLAYLLGRLVLKIAGWQIAGEAPKTNNCVIIAAPHTSNWDLILLLAAAFSFRLSINYMIKSTVFWWPLGPVLKYLGGIPVDRSKPNSLVQQMVDKIKTKEGINLVVPPSGTRSYTPYWKSGFYHIAKKAEAHLVCGYLDYSKKEAGLGPNFPPTHLTSDMDRLRKFYGPITAKYPNMKSRIRLKEEDHELRTHIEKPTRPNQRQ